LGLEGLGMEGCGAAWRHGPGAGGNDGLCMCLNIGIKLGAKSGMCENRDCSRTEIFSVSSP